MDNLKEYFTYAPTVKSYLTWKKKTCRKVVAGRMAGTFDKRHGYWVVRFGGKPYQVHRLIWEMFNGRIPDGMAVDHRDGDVHNNSIENLRLATILQNNLNRSGNKRDGFPKGIRLKNPSTGMLEARVKFQGKEYSKTSRDLETLREWVVAKRVELHKDFCKHT